jgi:hypothetical protein
MTSPFTPGLRAVLHQLHEGEEDLERQLHVVADRHRTDHEVNHTAINLARWSLQNRTALDPFLEGDAETQPQDGTSVMHAVREKTADLLGRRPETGMLLLEDLRNLYLMASGNAVLWTMVMQAAKNLHHTKLLEVVQECHDRTNRQVTWCNGMVKVLSPQVLSAV